MQNSSIRELHAQSQNLQNSEIINEIQIPAQQTIDFELLGIQEIQEAEIVVGGEEKNPKKCPMCGEHSRQKTFECPYCKNEGITTFICDRHFQSHLKKCHSPASGWRLKIEGGRVIYIKIG